MIKVAPTHAAAPPMIVPDEVVRALGVIVAPGDVFEVRILEPHRARGYSPRVIYGYFNDPQKVPPALQQSQLSGAKGIYVGMNPISPALLARTNNRLLDGRDNSTTADKDIVRRRWLLVDADPERPTGISSSDEEKAFAHEKTKSIYSMLRDRGWPDPVMADSGNGYHLIYRIDAEADDNRIKQCLEALSRQYTDKRVKIDTGVANASRIVKLYGTLAAKGEHCPELGRPHRLSCLLNVPEPLQVVPSDLLDALATPAMPDTPKQQAAPVPSQNGHSWDNARLQAFIDRHLSGCHPGAAMPYDGGYKWVLGTCPFNTDHSDRSAVIVIKADGMLGFKCHHDGCKGNNWKALRAV